MFTSKPPTCAGRTLALPRKDRDIRYLRPLGNSDIAEKINRGLPLPFVKSGIVSALEFEDVSKIYLDAHVNPGFSGGPVVFAPIGGSATDLRVAGIVANYLASLQPVVDQNRNTITDPEGKPVGLYVQENPGIVVAIGIRHVIELRKESRRILSVFR